MLVASKAKRICTSKQILQKINTLRDNLSVQKTSEHITLKLKKQNYLSGLY